MKMIIDGKTVIPDIGLVKEITDNAVTFLVKDKVIRIEVDRETLHVIQEINETSELALFPIDVDSKKICMAL